MPATPTASETLLPLPAPEPDELLVHALRGLGARYGSRGETLTIQGLTFKAGRATLARGERHELDGVIALLRRYPKTDVLVRGYADGSGHGRRSVRLSLRRAEAVRTALIVGGVNASRIRTLGLGARVPIASNSPGTGRGENRRVELVFSDLEGRFVAAADRSAAG